MDSEAGKEALAVSLAEEVAVALGETHKGPRKTIVRVVKLLGEERTRALLAETIEVEAAGGLRTADGSQRRTRGGVFFKLVKIAPLPASGRPSFASSAQRRLRPLNSSS